jgi:hypothetical protein
MFLIRLFLWTLVAVMTLQGFLHADEYGSAASLIGGMSLTMSIWGEAARSFFASVPKFVPLPRAFVVAALHETARHPGLHIVPSLQRKIKEHQRTWDRFREREMEWMLEHADLVGGLLSDPDATLLWSHWTPQVGALEAELATAQKAICSVSTFHQVTCQAAADLVARLEAELVAAKAAQTEWNQVLQLSRWASASGIYTVAVAGGNSTHTFSQFAQEIARLHDVTEPDDARLWALVESSNSIAWNLTVGFQNKVPIPQNYWFRRLIESLLVAEAWNGCLEHVRARESRVRRLMVAAGIQELFNVHERILNASLVVVTAAADVRLVQDWFGEASGYAWWLPEDLPALVRRCISQEAGDCVRIGPTEIVALSSQIAEKSKIVEDWVRRVFIGMWNAMPCIGVLFAVELVMLCMSMRYSSYVVPPVAPPVAIRNRRRDLLKND